MTIGSSYNHPANIATTLPSPSRTWAARFPNPPDLCFDYRKLVEQAGGIAKANLSSHRICIVGRVSPALPQRASCSVVVSTDAKLTHPTG